MSDNLKHEKDGSEEYNLYTENIVGNRSIKYRVFILMGKFFIRVAAFALVAFFLLSIFLPLIEGKLNQTEEERPEIRLTKDEYPLDMTAENDAAHNVNSIKKNNDITIDELNKLMTETQKSIVTVIANSSTEDPAGGGNIIRNTTAGLIIYEYITDKEYIILTNYDVVKDAISIGVSFGDNNVVPASLIKGNAETGMAVISVKEIYVASIVRANLNIAELDNSYLVRPGDYIITSGKIKGINIASEYGTVTDVKDGISGTDSYFGLIKTGMTRNVGDYTYMFNTDGNVVGITRNFIVDTEAEETDAQKSEKKQLAAFGISDLKALIQELTHGGGIAYLGISGINVTSSISKEFSVPVGAYVSKVIEGSPAYECGIQECDVITSINEEPVTSFKAMSDELYEYKCGDTIKVTVQRSGKNQEYISIDFYVTLGTK